MKILIVLFLITSCATGVKKRTYNVDDIKDEDFKSIQKVGYSKQDDFLSEVESAYSDALNEESLQRIFTYGGSVELKGPMGRIGKLCYKKKFEEAEKLIRFHSKAYNDNPIFWTQVGTCFLLQDQNRKALLFYNRAIGIKGDYAPALNNLGLMYMRDKDYSRALLAFRRARKSTAFGKTPRYNLANLYLSFGLYKEAEQHLNTLSQVSQKDVDVLNMLATSQLMQGNAAAAVSSYERIDNDFYEKPEFGLNYALALYLNKDPKKARDILYDVDAPKSGVWARYMKKVSKYIGGKI